MAEHEIIINPDGTSYCKGCKKNQITSLFKHPSIKGKIPKDKAPKINLEKKKLPPGFVTSNNLERSFSYDGMSIKWCQACLVYHELSYFQDLVTEEEFSQCNQRRKASAALSFSSYNSNKDEINKRRRGRRAANAL